jgi:hypothetical protein
MDRPESLMSQPEDTEYQLGFKDGVWAQMQMQKATQRALQPACGFHVVPANRLNGCCVRCGAQVNDAHGQPIK